jgi:uncharacterized protein DUF4388
MIKNNTLGLSLQDMLFLVGIKGSTGELVVESGNNIGTILMHGGRILQAFSPYSRAIGDLLVEDGLLSDSELIETLKIQKRNAYSPLGSLLIKMGRVTFEVIEMMVHEQIRTAVREFQSWNNVNFNFVEKNISPYDRIHLTVHEFISPATLQSAKVFFSLEATTGQSSPAAESSTVA